MAKYSPKSQKKVETAMREMKQGTLKSGRSGKKVTNPKQAIAIGLSEAREEGARVTAKAGAKKTARKKIAKKAARKTTAKKATPKKTAHKKTARKKAAAQ